MTTPLRVSYIVSVSSALTFPSLVPEARCTNPSGCLGLEATSSTLTSLLQLAAGRPLLKESKWELL